MSQEQKENLERVDKRLRGAILRFFLEYPAPKFYASYMEEFVEQRVGRSAPGSAGRIMRALRKEGALDYEVISRAESLYRITKRPSKQMALPFRNGKSQ